MCACVRGACAPQLHRWAEGYGATVLSNEELPGVWRLTSANNNTRIDLSKVSEKGHSVYQSHVQYLYLSSHAEASWIAYVVICVVGPHRQQSFRWLVRCSQVSPGIARVPSCSIWWLSEPAATACKQSSLLGVPVVVHAVHPAELLLLPTFPLPTSLLVVPPVMFAYAAAVVSSACLLTLQIRMLEFSDEVFGVRFPAETLLLQIDNHRVCTMSSSDPRSWMTQYGPVKRGGGSCLKMLQGPR